MTKISVSAILSAMVLLGGCADITHKPMLYHQYPIDEKNTAGINAANELNAKEDHDYTKGVRYYLSAPYLLVYTDGKGNLLWKIYNLPDPTKLMVAEPTQILAKTTSNLTFTNGMLTSSHTEADSTGIPKAVISALEKVLPLMAADAPEPKNEIPAPRLYKLKINKDTIELIGTQPTDKDKIQVSIKGS